MKAKKVVTPMLLLILSICLIYGLTACGSTSKPTATEPAPDSTSTDKTSGSSNKGEGNSTIVGNWSYFDESQPWTLGFTEDGDFYDSRGILMYVQDRDGILSNYTNYGSWRIRADGRIWFTGNVSLNMKTSEYSWAYSYELDGDTLVIDKYTFTRVK